MSQDAKQFIGETLADQSDVPFEELKEELMDEFDVASTTAAPYIYNYARYEERNGGRVVFDMKPQHRDAIQNADADDVDDLEAGDYEMDDPIPPAVGRSYYQLDVREPGHPGVPETGSYIERPLGGNTVEVEFDENTTFIEALVKGISVPDFPVMVIGAPGVGKSYAIKHACDQTNIPHDAVNFGVGITKEKLVGGFVPNGNGEALEDKLDSAQDLAENEDGLSVGEALEVLGVRDKFEWQDGILTRRVRKGGVFQADELNAAPPEATMALHGLLEDQGNRSLELLEKGEVVEPHEDFRFVGTMNPSSFAGTSQMNDAFKTRFIPIECPALEPEAEKGLLAQETDLPRSAADTLVELSRDIQSTDNTPPCSHRELLQIAAMEDVMGLEGATRMILLSVAETETQKDAVEKRIDFAF